MRYNLTAPTDDTYKKKRKSIENVLKNQGMSISGVTKAGSRARQEHRPDSDQDMIYAISGDPPKEEIHETLISILKTNFPNSTVKAGSSNKVLKMNFSSGEKFDIVLRSKEEFDKQQKKDKDYRRKNQ